MPSPPREVWAKSLSWKTLSESEQYNITVIYIIWKLKLKKFSNTYCIFYLHCICKWLKLFRIRVHEEKHLKTGWYMEWMHWSQTNRMIELVMWVLLVCIACCTHSCEGLIRGRKVPCVWQRESIFSNSCQYTNVWLSFYTVHHTQLLFQSDAACLAFPRILNQLCVRCSGQSPLAVSGMPTL